MKFKELIKKAVNWVKDSNRYKHLIGGAIIGACGGSFWTGLYGGVIAASCLEFKDKAHGGLWDWTDWAITVGGAVATSLLWLI